MKPARISLVTAALLMIMLVAGQTQAATINLADPPRVSLNVNDGTDIVNSAFTAHPARNGLHLTAHLTHDTEEEWGEYRLTGRQRIEVGPQPQQFQIHLDANYRTINAGGDDDGPLSHTFVKSWLEPVAGSGTSTGPLDVRFGSLLAGNGFLDVSRFMESSSFIVGPGSYDLNLEVKVISEVVGDVPAFLTTLDAGELGEPRLEEINGPRRGFTAYLKTSVLPEPASLVLLGAGGIALLGRHRRYH
ncbi:MAG: PEP-CTERM sorting domain-containing protein [Phycisphaeraceae bacterium]